MRQVHEARVLEVDRPGEHGPCDALVTASPGLWLRVKTADCLPLVLWRPGRLGVCHAGWRGLALGVVEAAVHHMEHAGALRVWIGPAIGPCCYEVGPEVAERFPHSWRPGPAGRPHLDLAGEAVRRLQALGVNSPLAAGVCTRCHQHLLFSHRGGGGRAGRNLSYASLSTG